MPDFVNDVRDKAMDVWRRAPTVVICCCILLVLLCSTCCMCAGCLPVGGAGNQPETPDRSNQVGVDLTIAQFSKEIGDRDMSKASFFRAYGQPDRTSEIGVFTFLHYTCTDGRAKVRCRTAKWKDADEVSVVSVDPE